MERVVLQSSTPSFMFNEPFPLRLGGNIKAGGKKMRWRRWLASEGRLAPHTMARAQRWCRPGCRYSRGTLLLARAPLGKPNDHPNSATDTRRWPAASTNPNFKFFENDASIEKVRRALSDTYCSLSTHYWSSLLGRHLSLAYTQHRY